MAPWVAKCPAATATRQDKLNIHAQVLGKIPGTARRCGIALIVAAGSVTGRTGRAPAGTTGIVGSGGESAPVGIAAYCDTVGGE